MTEREQDRALCVSQVSIERVGAHERVTVWTRGGMAGALVVQEGDGPAVAARLMGFEDGSEEATGLADDFAEHEGPEPRVYEA